MSRNMSNKREIIRLPEVPRSSTPEPEPAPKRPRTSRSTSKLSVQKSNLPEESTAVTTRSVRAPAARVPAPRGASRGRLVWTPSAEGELFVAKGSLPAAERSSWQSLGVQYQSTGKVGNKK